MGDEANFVGTGWSTQDAAFLQRSDYIGRTHLLWAEDHDVGLDRGQVDSAAGKRCNLLRQPSCVLMVLVQAARHLLQRDQAGSSQYPGLSHSAAQHLAD